MSTAEPINVKPSKRQIDLSQAMDRLRRYDRVNDRPGRQLVNVAKVGRNCLCPCGRFGKKFKNCCMSV